MGCSSSTTTTNQEQFPTFKRNFPNTYEGRKALYTFLHSKCDSTLFSKTLGNEIYNIQNSLYSSYQSQVEQVFLHHKAEITSHEVSQTEFYSLMYDHITTSILDALFLSPNLNIFNKLQLLFAFMFPEQDTEAEDEYNEDDDINTENEYTTKYQRSMQMLQLFEQTIPSSLTSITYCLKGKLNELEYNALKGMNRNIKFNKKYQPEMLTLVLTPFMLENKALITDIAELLAKGDDHLQIVNIFINMVDVNETPITNCNFNFADHEMMYTLLDSVNQNKKIKVLMIQCINNGKSNVVLAPENFKLIIKKLQSERLHAFHLGGFMLSKEFIHSLCFQLMSTRSLMVFSLDYVGLGECLIDKMLPALIRNTSLRCVSFSGFDIEAYGVDIEEMKMKLKEKNNKLRLLLFNKKCIVGYPFEPEIVDELI